MITGVGVGAEFGINAMCFVASALILRGTAGFAGFRVER